MTTYESQYKFAGIWYAYRTHKSPKRALADKEYLMKLRNTRQKVRVERTIKSVMKKGEKK